MRPCSMLRPSIALHRLESRCVPVVSWLGGSGSWETAANWDGGKVPTVDDDVEIDSLTPITVTITTNQQIRTLSILDDVTVSVQTGFLTLKAASPNLFGTVALTASTFTASTKATLEGQLISDGASANTLNGTFHNNGEVIHKGTGVFRIDGGSTFTNTADGTFTFAGDGDISATSGTNTFDNLGLFRKTAGAGDSGITIAFNNTGGTVRAETGTLDMTVAGTWTGGQLGASAGATVEVGGHTWSGTFTGTGAGAIALVAPLTLTGPTTFDFPGELFRWNGTSITATGTTLTNIGQVNFTSPTSNTFLGTLTNSGTIRHANTGSLLLNGGAALNNPVGGVYTFEADAVITTTSGGGTLTNAGLIRKTAGTGTAQITQPLNHTGTIEAQTGRILLPNTGTHEDAAYTAAAGATIDLGNTTYKGTLTGSGAGVVEIDSGLTIDKVGATLNFPAGLLVWNAGAITVTDAKLTNKTSLTLAGTVTRTLNGGAFQNDGTVIHAGTGLLALNGGVVFTNPTAGVYEVQTDADISTTSGGGRFVNAGKFRKTGGTGDTDVTQPFDNQGGTVEALAGVIDFTGGTNTGGSYNAATGAEIILGSTATYAGTYTGTGGGFVTINGLTLAAAGMTADFPAGYLRWVSGNVTTGGATFTNKQSLTLANAGTVTLVGGVFDNRGTVLHTGAGDLALNGGAVLQNSAGSVYELTTNADLTTTSFGGTFVNAGKFRKTGGTGDTDFVIPFNLEGGSVEALAGVIDFSGGTNTGGSFFAGTGAEIILGNTATHAGTFTGTGTGLVTISGFTLAAATALDFAPGLLRWVSSNLTTNGHTLTNAGTLTLANASTVAVVAGTFATTGTTVHSGGGALALNTAARLDILPTGTYDMQSDASLTTTSGGGSITNAGLFKKSVGTGTSTVTALPVTNSGTIRVDSGVFSVTSSLTNFTGSTLTGGSYQLKGTLRFPGANVVTNAATVTLDGPASALLNHTNGTDGLAKFAVNTGSLNLLNGRILTAPDAVTNSGAVVIGTGSTLATAKGDYTQSAGTTTADGTLDPAGTTAFTAGVARGSGTVAATTAVSGGEVRPGASPGILTVNGDYTQTAGTLAVELNGPTAGQDYDRLTVNGAVTLGGQFQASLNYSAAVGENFVVIANDGSDAISGTFTNLPDATAVTINGVKFQVNYKGGDGNDLTLTRLSTGIGFITIDDGGVQRSRVRSVTVTFAGVVTLPTNTADAFAMTRTGPGSPTGSVALAVDTSASTASMTVAKITFTGPVTEFTSLIDGRYTFTVFGGLILDAGGQPIDGDGNGTAGGDGVTALHRMYGDTDGNAAVNFADFLAFRAAFGTKAGDPAYASALDFDGDGAINFADFLAFRARFGVTLP